MLAAKGKENKVIAGVRKNEDAWAKENVGTPCSFGYFQGISDADTFC